MKAIEIYQLWKARFKPNCVSTNCIHGKMSGGPGYLGFGECELPEHNTVRYGCDFCPDDCPDAEYNPSIFSFGSFMEYACDPTLNSLITDYVDIDIQSIDEVRDYFEKLERQSQLKQQKDEESFLKVKAMDLPTDLCEQDPFAEYQ